MKEIFTEEECIQVVQRLYSEIVNEVNNDINGYYGILSMLYIAGAMNQYDSEPSELTLYNAIWRLDSIKESILKYAKGEKHKS